jgi:hypothetical protein
MVSVLLALTLVWVGCFTPDAYPAAPGEGEARDAVAEAPIARTRTDSRLHGGQIARGNSPALVEHDDGLLELGLARLSLGRGTFGWARPVVSSCQKGVRSAGPAH